MGRLLRGSLDVGMDSGIGSDIFVECGGGRLRVWIVWCLEVWVKR